MSFSTALMGVRAGASFYPKQILDLILDLDGAKGVTNLGTVRNWRDKSAGIEHDAVQLTTTAQPAFTASDANFNGHGSLNFDGVDDYLPTPDHPDLQLGGGLTIYLTGTLASTGVLQRLVSKIGATREYSLVATTVGKAQLFVRNAADTAWYSVTTSAVVDDGSAHVVRAMYDLATASVRVDTGTEATVAAPDFTTSAEALALAASSNGSGNATLDTPRILIYNNAVSPADDTAIMAELNALYKGVGTPTGFDFSGVQGLVLDLDGDKGIEIEGTSAWADQSGSANVHDAAQATAAKRPVYLVNDPLFNGRGSLSFTETADVLVVPDHVDLQLTGGLTAYCTFRLPSGVGSGSKIMVAKRSGAAGNAYMLYWVASAGKLVAVIRNAADTGNYAVVSSTKFNLGATHVAQVKYDGATLSLTVDGAAEGSVAAPDFKEVGQDLGIGGYNNGVAGMTGSVGRLLIWKRAVTAQEDTRIMRYLQDEYTARAFDSGFSNGFQSR